MKLIKYVTMVVCAIGLFNSVVPSSFASDNKIDLVKQALARWLCMEYYWMGGLICPGGTIPVMIKLEDNKFSVWASDQLVTKNTRAFGFYWGRIKAGEAAIVMREVYTTDLEGGQQSSRFEDRKRIFELGEVYKSDVNVPSDCTPRYDSPSTIKELMIDNVIKTIEYALNLGKLESKHPYDLSRFTLNIADFNTDYPYTYVLVEPSEKLYIVTLHDPQNYDSGEYERMVPYAWNLLYDEERTDQLIDKIKKYSIVKKLGKGDSISIEGHE